VSFLAAFLCTALLAAAPAEVEVPANAGWVTDQAGMLSEQQERELELLMESYKQGSGHEIALLTVPDLGGQTVERYALEVGRAWEMGREGKSDAALLLVAKAERKIRIEVGRGLEGNLPDIRAGQIIRNIITPAFKSGDFAGGLRSGVEAMHAAIGGDYGPIERSAGGRRSAGRSGSIFTLFWIGFIFFLIRRRGRRGGGGGVLPWLLLSGAMSSGHGRSSGSGGFGGGGGGFSGFGGGGGFSGGGASGGW
jgi:uncharacterized protein